MICSAASPWPGVCVWLLPMACVPDVKSAPSRVPSEAICARRCQGHASRTVACTGLWCVRRHYSSLDVFLSMFGYCVQGSLRTKELIHWVLELHSSKPSYNWTWLWNLLASPEFML